MKLLAMEIDICPFCVHCFLLTNAGTEQELEQIALFTIRCGEQGVQILGAVCLDLLLGVFNSIRFQHRPIELVMKNVFR